MDQSPSDPNASRAPHPAALPPESPAPAQQPPRKENLKETVESILVALILAFVFRAFIVEAFVIPSGSMAPTLLGAHMRFRCQECGYDFDLNYPASTSDDDLNIPAHAPLRSVFSVHCANCGFQVQPNRHNPEQSAESPPVHYGDRILVLKYLYLLQEPQRWDIVVFKSPTADGSRRQEFTQNFIKRLVGRPGETVMLLDGDVYVSPNDYAGPEAQRWQVQTKPRRVQEDLWRIVYHNDFLPLNQHPIRQRRRWVMPWQIRSGEGWQVPPSGQPDRIIRFQNMDGAGTLFFNKDANPGTYPLTDWLPYNETKDIRLTDSASLLRRQLSLDYDAYGDGDVPRWYVSDLKLQFAYHRTSGTGAFKASINKLDHTFIAEFTPGQARLLYRPPGTHAGQERFIGDAPLPRAGPLMVEFTNVDYQVTLRVNGRDLIQSTPQQYRPDVADLLRRHAERQQLLRNVHEPIRSVFGAPSVELSAEQQHCHLAHLSLWRDIYYTPHYYDRREAWGALAHGDPDRPVRLHRRGDPVSGDQVRDPAIADHLENEYFVLGDNSILSGDARAWRDDVDLIRWERLYAESGRVPERFLLGKAFFVYWPAGFRPIDSSLPGIIPNFGRMRFIH